MRHSPSSRARKGFTLIEIVVVTVVVGILAAIGMIYYGSSVSQSQDAAAKLGHIASVKAVGGEFDATDFSTVPDYNANPSALDGGAIGTLSIPGQQTRAAVNFVPQSAGALTYDPTISSTRYGEFSVAIGTDNGGGRVAGIAVASESGNCVMVITGPGGSVLAKTVLDPAPGEENYFVTSNGENVPCNGAGSLTALMPAATVLNINPATGETTGGPSGPVAVLPGPPTGLVLAVDAGTSVDLSWIAPTTGDPATGYIVTVTRVDGAPMIESPVIVVGGASATVSGLDAATEYTFTVAGTNTAGTGPDSDPVSALMPDEPLLLAKSFDALGAGQVTLNWASTPRATTYEVWRFGAGADSLAAELDPAFASFKYPDGGGAWTRIASAIPADQLAYTDTLTGNGKFVYAVKALNVRGTVMSSTRIALTGTAPAGALNSTLGQGSSLICKNAGGPGGKYLLAVSETNPTLPAVVRYTVAYQGGSITGTFAPSLHNAGIILDIPANVVQTITLRNDATSAVLATRGGTGTFGVQANCP